MHSLLLLDSGKKEEKLVYQYKTNI